MYYCFLCTQGDEELSAETIHKRTVQSRRKSHRGCKCRGWHHIVSAWVVILVMPLKYSRYKKWRLQTSSLLSKKVYGVFCNMKCS